MTRLLALAVLGAVGGVGALASPAQACDPVAAGFTLIGPVGGATDVAVNAHVRLRYVRRSQAASIPALELRVTSGDVIAASTTEVPWARPDVVGVQLAPMSDLPADTSIEVYVTDLEPPLLLGSFTTGSAVDTAAPALAELSEPIVEPLHDQGRADDCTYEVRNFNVPVVNGNSAVLYDIDVDGLRVATDARRIQGVVNCAGRDRYSLDYHERFELSPGHHVLAIVATDLGGNRSQPVYADVDVPCDGGGCNSTGARDAGLWLLLALAGLAVQRRASSRAATLPASAKGRMAAMPWAPASRAARAWSGAPAPPTA